MSIASKLQELDAAKDDIFDAIEAKGVTVPAGSGLADAPALIGSIPGGGGGDIPPYYPPIPDEIKLFNCLFCTSNIGTYDNDKKIIFTALSSTQNDNVSFYVDYETKNTNLRNWFDFFVSSDNLIQFGWSYSYTDSNRIICRNGASQYLISVPTSYANTRKQLVMTNYTVADATTNNLLRNEQSIYSSINIGTLKFPGANEMLANKMFYYNVKISRYGLILCDLVPAKKNNIPGFYDKLSGNFYNAVNSSVWDCI